MSTDTLGNKKGAIKETFYGLASLIAAFISIFFLAGSFVITVMDISPATFVNMNILSYLVYCSSAPLAVGLGVWGITRKHDSRILSVTAIGLTVVPFLVLFWQFVTSLIRYN